LKGGEAVGAARAGGVVVMDLDGKFDMRRFVQLLESHLAATHAAVCRERRYAPSRLSATEQRHQQPSRKILRGNIG
jgi:hypothetical protein